MVTIKNSQVIPALMALNELAGKEFSVRTAVKIKKIHKEISEQYKVIEEVRKDLIEKHAERDAEGNQVPGEKAPSGEATVKIKQAEVETFNEKLKELLDLTVSVSISLSVEDFGETPVTPGTIAALGELVSE